MHGRTLRGTAKAAAYECRRPSSVMRSLLSDLAELLDCLDLRSSASQFGLSFGELDGAGAILERFFSALLRLQGGRFVDVLSAQRRVGEHSDQVRLNFD